jgi:hypothetical protein
MVERVRRSPVKWHSHSWLYGVCDRSWEPACRSAYKSTQRRVAVPPQTAADASAPIQRENATHEVNPRKTRGRHGLAVAPFELRLLIPSL